MASIPDISPNSVTVTVAYDESCTYDSSYIANIQGPRLWIALYNIQLLLRKVFEGGSLLSKLYKVDFTLLNKC